MKITGYVATFADETIIAGEWRERLAPGCFSRTLREQPDVVMLLDHDPGRVLGRTTAGTLGLVEDATGLRFDLDVDTTTPEGQTAAGTVGRGDVHGCSFGFRIKAEEWHDGGRRLPLRVIRDLDLFEATLTCSPAYNKTSAALVRDAVSASRHRAERAMRLRGMLGPVGG